MIRNRHGESLRIVLLYLVSAKLLADERPMDSWGAILTPNRVVHSAAPPSMHPISTIALPLSALERKKFHQSSELELLYHFHHQETTTNVNHTRRKKMPPPTRLPQSLSRFLVSRTTSSRPSTVFPPLAGTCRAIHSSPPDPANVAPFYATGPPPEPPQPAAEHPYAKIERRRKQAELLRNARELRYATSSTGKSKTPLRKRFWQDVHIKESDGAPSLFHLYSVSINYLGPVFSRGKEGRIKDSHVLKSMDQSKTS